jgi:hypothetical protein
LLLSQHRDLAPQSTHFLLGRLAGNGRTAPVVTLQLPSPRSQLVRPHVELPAHLGQRHTERASLRNQADRFGFELRTE